MTNTRHERVVVVRHNRVELGKVGTSGPLHLFAFGAVAAVINGDSIVVTFKTGRVCLYRLSKSGNSVCEVGNI